MIGAGYLTATAAEHAARATRDAGPWPHVVDVSWHADDGGKSFVIVNGFTPAYHDDPADTLAACFRRLERAAQRHGYDPHRDGYWRGHPRRYRCT